jgi:hypothetical protein
MKFRVSGTEWRGFKSFLLSSPSEKLHLNIKGVGGERSDQEFAHMR